MTNLVKKCQILELNSKARRLTKAINNVGESVINGSTSINPIYTLNPNNIIVGIDIINDLMNVRAANTMTEYGGVLTLQTFPHMVRGNTDICPSDNAGLTVMDKFPFWLSMASLSTFGFTSLDIISYFALNNYAVRIANGDIFILLSNN